MPSSPSAGRANMRLYESYITTSPKAHMVFKAPLSRLRQRTAELVDQITGASLPPEVVQQESALREEKRKWRCGACKVAFAGDRELNKHFHLFPAHVEVIEARRQGRPAAIRHSASADAGLMLAKSPSAKRAKEIDLTNGASSTLPRSSRPHRQRTRTSSTGDILSSAGKPLGVPGQYEAAQEQEFTVVGPVTHKDTALNRRPRRRGSQRRRTSPSPNANEEQGRASVRRIEEERRRMAEVARAAHEAKVEAEAAAAERRRASQERGEEFRLRRRSISEGIVGVLKRQGSSLSLRAGQIVGRGSMDMQRPGEGGTTMFTDEPMDGAGPSTAAAAAAPDLIPNVRWDKTTKKATSYGDVFFDAETGEMGSGPEDDEDGETAFSSVHGETAAVAHAPAMLMMNFPSSSSSAAAPVVVEGMPPRRGSGSAVSAGTSGSGQRKAAPLRRESVDAGRRGSSSATGPAPPAPPPRRPSTATSRRGSSSKAAQRDPFAEAGAEAGAEEEASRPKLDWVPSSRPLPTVPVSGGGQRLSGSFSTSPRPSSSYIAAAVPAAAAPATNKKAAPLLPPIDTSDSLLVLLGDEAAGEDAAARPSVPQARLMASPTSQAPAAAAAAPTSPPLAPRPRRNTNPFLGEANMSSPSPSSPTELPYLRQQATAPAIFSSSPTTSTMSPATPATPAFATLRSRTKSADPFIFGGAQHAAPAPSSPPPPRYSTIINGGGYGPAAAPQSSPPLPPRSPYHAHQRASTLPMQMTGPPASPPPPGASPASPHNAGFADYQYAQQPAPRSPPPQSPHSAHYYQQPQLTGPAGFVAGTGASTGAPGSPSLPSRSWTATPRSPPMSPLNPYFAELHGGDGSTPPSPAAVRGGGSGGGGAFSPVSAASSPTTSSFPAAAARTRAYSSNNPFARQAFVEQQQQQRQREGQRV